MRFDKIVLATGNKHKIKEIKQALVGEKIGVLTAADLPDFPEIEETGKTLAENAIIKARAVFTQFRIPAIADDTGLEVRALNGRPGVFSARYAGPKCSFADNNQKLLRELSAENITDRTARFVTVIAVCYADGEKVLTGEIVGRITEEPSGDNGFGYDPIFFYPPVSKTLAELSLAEKNDISHRGMAIRRLVDWLKGWRN